MATNGITEKEGACLGRTSPAWQNYLFNNSLLNMVNYWKLSDENFLALEPGQKFFFFDSVNQKITGYAEYRGVWRKMDVQSAWTTYLTRNGTASFNDFISLLNTESNNNILKPTSKISCIELSNLKLFEKPVDYIYKGQQCVKILSLGKECKLLSKLCVAKIKC